MLQVVMGPKGTGKTQRVIDMVNNAIHDELGSVVCIERGNRLTYDISHKARLIDVANFSMDSFAMLKGFISGLYAGNYDISHIFIDSLFKISGDSSLDSTAEFLDWLDSFSNDNKIRFTVMISAPIESATPGMMKYIVQ